MPSLVEIGSAVLEKIEDLLNVLNFCNYLPLGKGVDLPLNKSKSLHMKMICAESG